MGGNNFYLLTALPVLGDFGSAPPMRPFELVERVADAGGPRLLLDTLFLGDDLLQREAFLSGEQADMDLAVLTSGQGRNEEPLPSFLTIRDESVPRMIQSDALWEAYFRYAAEIARRERSVFLAAWVGCEIALRNAMVRARARILELDASEYLVAADLEKAGMDISAVLGEWGQAATPLSGLSVLDRARWAWLDENDSRFTFKNDEVAVYGARLLLLRRWQSISKLENQLSSDSAAGGATEPGTRSF